MTPLPHQHQRLIILDEVCPNCGRFVPELRTSTGWCDACSVTALPECNRCGKQFSPGKKQKTCGSCRYELWLEHNADAIERTMAVLEVSVGRAKKFVRDVNRPICNSCGEPIEGRPKGTAFFCAKKPHCRRGGSSYHYHRRIKNRSHKEALEIAITASMIAKATNEISK